MNKQEIEKAIKVLASFDRTEDMDLRDAVEIAVPILQQQLTNGWVSVSEMLPDENKTVLIYAMSRSRGSFVNTIGLISHDFWFTESGVGLLSYPNGDNYDVIAWQPLPTPFTQPSTGNT